MAHLTKAQLVLVAECRDVGETWSQIGRRLGMDGTTVHMAVDARYAAARRKAINERRRCGHAGQAPVPEDQVTAGRAWMNRDDTRDLTGVLLGDPPPGRSALDEKRRAAR